MNSESKLKAQMLAAIAAKKKKISTDSPSAGTAPKHPEKEVVAAPKVTVKEVVKESVKTVSTPDVPSSAVTQLEDLPVESSEVDWSRIFFGRPLRIAVCQKQIYYALPDVFGVANDPNKKINYTELLDTPANQKFIAPLIKRIRFPNPYGGQEILYAATAEDMIKIINKFDLTFSESIDKWLLATTKSFMVVLS